MYTLQMSTIDTLQLSKMDNSEKLATQGTQDKDEQNKNTTQYVFHIAACFTEKQQKPEFEPTIYRTRGEYVEMSLQINKFNLCNQFLSHGEVFPIQLCIGHL
jgi:CRISPR/Cas system endoribonuclease Cas6 (RAMP superfamily)